MGAKLQLNTAKEFIPLFAKGTHSAVNVFQLFFGGHTGFVVDGMGFDMHHVKKAAHTDHEKFIQIAGEDGDKLQSFQQRQGFIHGFTEDTVVEPQPGKFTVLSERIFFSAHGFSPSVLTNSTNNLPGHHS